MATGLITTVVKTSAADLFAQKVGCCCARQLHNTAGWLPDAGCYELSTSNRLHWNA